MKLFRFFRPSQYCATQFNCKYRAWKMSEKWKNNETIEKYHSKYTQSILRRSLIPIAIFEIHRNAIKSAFFSQ